MLADEAWGPVSILVRTSGVEFGALCSLLKIFHSNFDNPCLHGALLVHMSMVMLELVWAY